MGFIAALYDMVDPVSKILAGDGDLKDSLKGLIWTPDKTDNSPDGDEDDNESDASSAPYSGGNVQGTGSFDCVDMHQTRIRRRLGSKTKGRNWGNIIPNVVVFIPRVVLTLIAAVPIGIYKGVQWAANYFLRKGKPDSAETPDKVAKLVAGLTCLGGVYALSKLGGATTAPRSVCEVSEPEPVELQDQWRNAAANTYDELSGSTSGKAAMTGAALAGAGAVAAAGYGAYKAIQGVRNRGKSDSQASTESKSGSKSKKSRDGKRKDKKESSSVMIYVAVGCIVLVLLYLIFASDGKESVVRVVPDIENGLLRQD